MTATDEYTSSYPLAGDVALLCEGDLVGYETALLRRWTATQLRTTPLVDVIPVGTSTAAFGMADSLGRARPVMVIEDRDFRSQEEANKDCRGLKDDRQARGVGVVDWRAWQRHEIENYFLDNVVLIPVFQQWFPSCDANSISQALSDVLAATHVFQAAEYALFHTRRQWSRLDPGPRLRNNLLHRPRWDDATDRFIVPGVDEIESRLAENISSWKSAMYRDSGLREPIQGEVLVATFQEKIEQWKAVDLDATVWRMDWAGKELLYWLRVVMTARFGWPDRATGSWRAIAWGDLNRRKRDALNREIEVAMRPDLVAGLLARLHSDEPGDGRDEWKAIVESLRG